MATVPTIWRRSVRSSDVNRSPQTEKRHGRRRSMLAGLPRSTRKRHPQTQTRERHGKRAREPTWHHRAAHAPSEKPRRTPPTARLAPQQPQDEVQDGSELRSWFGTSSWIAYRKLQSFADSASNQLQLPLHVQHTMTCRVRQALDATCNINN